MGEETEYQYEHRKDIGKSNSHTKMKIKISNISRNLIIGVVRIEWKNDVTN